MRKFEGVKKRLSFLMALTLVISLVPVPALAAEGDACTVTADCAGVYVEGLCNVCGQPEPAPKHGHVYEGEAQYAQKDETVHMVTRACITCEEQPTETVEEGHTYVEGICACGKAEPCAHSGGNATCKELAVCESCGAPYGELAGHNYGTDADGKCDVCGADCEHTYVEGVCACGVSEPVAEPECICSVKCNKERQDEACPVCSDGEYEGCIGNEVSAFLSGEYTTKGKMQYCQSGIIIDVRGGKRGFYNLFRLWIFSKILG